MHDEPFEAGEPYEDEDRSAWALIRDRKPITTLEELGAFYETAAKEAPEYWAPSKEMRRRMRTGRPWKLLPVIARRPARRSSRRVRPGHRTAARRAARAGPRLDDPDLPLALGRAA
jgi:hypothetical protein